MEGASDSESYDVLYSFDAETNAIIAKQGRRQNKTNTSSVDKNELPPNWAKVYTPQGRVYYQNHIDKTTQWDRPMASKNTVNDNKTNTVTSHTQQVEIQSSPQETNREELQTQYIPNDNNHNPIQAPQQIPFDLKEDEYISYTKNSDKSMNSKPNKPSVDNNKLPPNWAKVYTPQGRVYYQNHIDKTTQWHRPIAPKNTVNDNKTSPQETNGVTLQTQYSCVPPSVPSVPSAPIEKYIPNDNNNNPIKDDTNISDKSINSEPDKPSVDNNKLPPFELIKYVNWGEFDMLIKKEGWGEFDKLIKKEGIEIHAPALLDGGRYHTIIGNFKLNKGKWYYEVLLITPRCGQMGWGTHTQGNDSIAGLGTGDDSKGFAYDGYRSKKWNGGTNINYGKKWNENDIIGFAIDLDNRTMNFYLNGQDLGIAYKDFNIYDGIAPSLSILSGGRFLYISNPKYFKQKIPNGYKPLSLEHINEKIKKRVEIEKFNKQRVEIKKRVEIQKKKQKKPIVCINIVNDNRTNTVTSQKQRVEIESSPQETNEVKLETQSSCVAPSVPSAPIEKYIPKDNNHKWINDDELPPDYESIIAGEESKQAPKKGMGCVGGCLATPHFKAWFFTLLVLFFLVCYVICLATFDSTCVCDCEVFRQIINKKFAYNECNDIDTCDEEDIVCGFPCSMTYVLGGGFWGIVATAYVFYLYEVFCCSSSFSYLRNMHGQETIHNYIERVRRYPPNIWWKVECYHYETKTRKTSSGGTETYEEKVITHVALGSYKYNSWKDVSIPMSGLDEWKLTKLKNYKAFSFANARTEIDYNFKAAVFRRINDFDVCQNFWYGVEIQDFKNKLLVEVESGGRSSIISVSCYVLSSLVLLTTCFRMHFAAVCGRKKYIFHKQVSI